MEGVSTGSLRALAPKWSLAGDDQLLNILKSTHQRIISKCQDVNSKLEEMASALDDASINLQNVNNKFMALSNSQFIESRVYDDDADLATDTQLVQEAPQARAADETAALRRALAALQRAHDAAEILDDSDSDSDAEISVVLKPKDMYSHRPLPYIIGSQPWKNKWHAGLIVEDSDSDSCTSKQDGDIDQYSESEEESTRPPLEENTLSESSSPLPGSLGASLPAGGAPPAARPADIAAALAKRLAPHAHQVVQEEVEDHPPAAAAQHRKVYKPEQPASSRVFSDEPPPLACSEHSSDEDIFAEINRHTPYTQRSRAAANLAEGLFSFEKPPEGGDSIFNDFAPTQTEKQSREPKPTLFQEESEPEFFAEQPKRETQNSNLEKDETSSKKPVGGISLFGANKGAENIRAAILKRQQRKSSTSGDESGSDYDKNRINNVKKQTPEKPKVLAESVEEDAHKLSKNADETDNKVMTKKEKDIFDDLFSKSEKVQKKTPGVASKAVKDTPVKEKVTVKEKEKSVKDLFNDKLFDDIDDIFTSHVKLPTKSNQKSIFDDDDLFSDIDTTNTTNKSRDHTTIIKGSNKSNKSIFESDDELISDVKTVSDKPVIKNVESHTVKDHHKNENIDNEGASKIENIKKPTEITKERNLFDDSPQTVKSDPKPQIKSKSIFDSDSDDDIFAKIKTPDNKITNIAGNDHTDMKTKEKEDNFNAENNANRNQLSSEKLEAKENVLIQSPSLFEEDEIDDLFIAANKLKSETNQSKITKVVKLENKHSFVKNPVIDASKDNEIDTLDKIDDEMREKDEPPKHIKNLTLDTKMILESKIDQNITSSKSVTFDDDLLRDDLFSTTREVFKNTTDDKVPDIIESSQQVNESETKVGSNKILESEIENTKNNQVEVKTNAIHRPVEYNVKQPVFDDIIGPAKGKDILTAAQKAPISSTGIFDDILSEPPAFEKPAEPKKSKNVNALFDDDSDDESLFFKKDDIISDEKPEIFSKNADFDIFVDEPPDDIDFTTKPAKTTNMNDDDDLFSSVPKTSHSIPSTKSTNDEDIFSPEKESVPKLTEKVKPDNEDEFSSVLSKETVPKSVEIDKNKDFKSVPENQEVPDNVKVLVSNIIYDNIISEVSERPQDNLFDKNENKDLWITRSDKNTENALNDKANPLSTDIDSDEELFATLPDLPKSSQKDHNEALKSNQNDIIVEDKNTNEFDDIFKSESPKKEEIKKIGKINTKNFNINVNALMPGASPKKTPKERKDGQESESSEPKMVKLIPDETGFIPKSIGNKDGDDLTVSHTKSDNLLPDETDFKPKLISNKDENKVTDEQEPKPVKSITFDDKSESGVLDNNFSKQRPRIQVKRRPSTRKARHEAVRKSAVDFGDDTDNSSSFDEPKPRDVGKDESRSTIEQYLSETDPNEKYNINKEDNQNKKVSSQDKFEEDNIKIAREQDNDTPKDVPEEISDIFVSILTNTPSQKELPSVSSEIKESSKDTQHFNENKQTTTKIVYILNDEDIFTTDSTNIEKSDELFENKNAENDDIFASTEGIKTLGKTYKETENKKKEEFTSKKETNSKDNKPSLFDDSDEDLFNKTKKVAKKTTIFDSDSEEDLFSGKKSTEKKVKEVRNREVKERKEMKKGSLFGDDDDDDLFGLKRDKAKPKPIATPSTSKETVTTASKTAEPVFDDPLSMLGDDD